MSVVISENTHPMRERYLRNYAHDEDMRIIERGDYEGELIWVPYFHTLVEQREVSFARSDGTYGFEVTDEDRTIFPELSDAERVFIAIRTDSRVEHYIEGWME